MSFKIWCWLLNRFRHFCFWFANATIRIYDRLVFSLLLKSCCSWDFYQYLSYFVSSVFAAKNAWWFYHIVLLLQWCCFKECIGSQCTSKFWLLGFCFRVNRCNNIAAYWNNSLQFIKCLQDYRYIWTVLVQIDLDYTIFSWIHVFACGESITGNLP